MSEELLMQLISALFGILVMMIAWAGHRIYSKLDSIDHCLKTYSQDFARDIAKLWTRVERIEERINAKHPEGN